MARSRVTPPCPYCGRGHVPVPGPALLDKEAVEATFGWSSRQLKRWVATGRIRRVKVSGATGPLQFIRCDLDALLRESIVAAGEKAGRKPA